MLKAELKQKWGNYCDTDKLVDDVMALLTKYHHYNTENGVGEMLNRYFTNKKDLIDLFMKSKNYVGNMRICLDIEMERTSNNREIKNFCENFPSRIEAMEFLCSKMDEHGKTLDDYTRVGFSRFKARDLHYGDIAQRLARNEELKDKFRTDGYTKASYETFVNFHNAVISFKHSTEPNLSEYTEELLTQYKMNATFKAGMKTSRAFNRMCSVYGIDKHPSYNKLFAQYADMVSGLKRKLKFYISLNPLDYLAMSFGNSWSSCHTIDKNNERKMPNSYSGMHCGGTVSYMLDETSIITYVYARATEDVEEGKIYRNMFHYGNGLLVQGRVYPQGNDGATDLYRTFRRYVQTELSELLGIEDDWLRKNSSPGNYVNSYGDHYRDYEHFDGCTVTYPREMPDAIYGMIDVGHVGICPICGDYKDEEDDDTGYLTHACCEDDMRAAGVRV